MNLFWDLFESRNEKLKAKKFGNVIHPPILCDNIDNETPVIFLLPKPELHLLIGLVNKMYAALESFLESLWPDSKNWLKLCNVKKEDYHGGSFACNKSIKFLKSIDRLEALSPSSSCTTFAKDYMKLGISVTPTLHTVIFHIIEFSKITGRGLGPWSEQTGETVLHDNKETWKRYKVNDTDLEIYGENLPKEVSDYNSQHL